jgi:hypothetical protein
MSNKLSIVISYPSCNKSIVTFKKFLFENTTNKFNL